MIAYSRKKRVRENEDAKKRKKQKTQTSLGKQKQRHSAAQVQCSYCTPLSGVCNDTGRKTLLSPKTRKMPTLRLYSLNEKKLLKKKGVDLVCHKSLSSPMIQE